MAVKSGFYTSFSGDRVYTADNFNKLFDGIISNGILENFENALKPEISGQKVVIKSGRAWINNHWIHNSTSWTHEIPAGTARQDSVVLYSSDSDREISIVYKKGSTEVDRGAGFFEMQLAIIDISDTGATLIDKRADETVCGFAKMLMTEDLAEQVEQNKNDIEKLNADSYNLYDKAKATENAYVNSKGNITNIQPTDTSYYNKGFYASDYIDLEDILKVNVSACRSYAFYDSDKVKVISSGDPTVNTGSTTLAVPENARYLRITVNEVRDGVFQIFNGKNQRGKKIAFIGDSITWGYNDNIEIQVSKPYPQIIKEEYGFAECYNLGINGRTLGGDGAVHDGKKYGSNPITSKLHTIPSDSDIVVIFAGTNDFGADNYYVPLGEQGDRSVMTFYGSLSTLMEDLIPLFLGKRIFVATPLHRVAESKTTDGVTRRLKDYAQAIRDVCEEYGVEVIDLYKYGEFFAKLTDFRSRYTQSGLHPNQDWYYILARKIGDYIVNHLN